ncbi:MAG: hypothetical protein KC619_15370 [Myxococcales bacterium]|nr:hypothetical protein [Myxococcales bacterium]
MIVLLTVLAPMVLGGLGVPFVARASTPGSARWRAATTGIAMLASSLAAALLSPIDGPIAGFDTLAPAGLGYFALDGLSAPLYPFVAGLTVAIVLGTPSRFARPRGFAGLLATGTLYLGLLAARHPVLVAGFWVLTAVPTLLELRGREGGRIFAIHRTVSTVLVATGVIAVGVAPTSPLAASLLVLGVMVREGIFPFHGWVPRFFERASLGTALLFVQPQVGAYVLARFVIAQTGEPASLLLDVLGVVTLLYGAGLALGQRSSRRALGYLVVSQSAPVLIALADGGTLGATGALLVIVSVGLAQTGFGLALWATEARRGALRLDVESGGHSTTPALAGSTLVLGLASVGLPGTLSFVAEDLVFHATIEARPWVGLVMVIATALNGIGVMRVAFRLFGGKRRTTGEGDLTGRERTVLGLLGATLIVLGLLPQPLLAPAAAMVDAAQHPAPRETTPP